MKILIVGGPHNGKHFDDVGDELRMPAAPDDLSELRYIKRRLAGYDGMREIPVYALSSLSGVEIIRAYEDR